MSGEGRERTLKEIERKKRNTIRRWEGRSWCIFSLELPCDSERGNIRRRAVVCACASLSPPLPLSVSLSFIPSSSLRQPCLHSVFLSFPLASTPLSPGLTGQSEVGLGVSMITAWRRERGEWKEGMWTRSTCLRQREWNWKGREKERRRKGGGWKCVERRGRNSARWFLSAVHVVSAAACFPLLLGWCVLLVAEEEERERKESQFCNSAPREEREKREVGKGVFEKKEGKLNHRLLRRRHRGVFVIWSDICSEFRGKKTRDEIHDTIDIQGTNSNIPSSAAAATREGRSRRRRFGVTVTTTTPSPQKRRSEEDQIKRNHLPQQRIKS